MNILLSVPTYENICPETFKSIYSIKSQHNLSFDYVKGYTCDRARNNIAQKAIEGGFDYVLMIDSDIIVPPNIDELIGFDVCFGVYPRKNTKTHETELFKFTERDFTDRFTYPELPQEPFKVKGSGLGCAMIKTDVFKRLSFPWFKYVTYSDGSTLSEDLFFCDLATRNGIDLYANPSVRCGHLARYFQYE